MAVARMRELCKVADTTLRGLLSPVNLPMAVEFTIKVRRPCGVNGATVNMPYFSMKMIRFRMDVEQRSREHPYGCPDEDDHARPRAHTIYRLEMDSG